MSAPEPLVHSVRRRYLVTLAGNGVRMAASFLTATIVPRALGPSDYGDFQFISSTATAMRTLLDAGMSSAHFTYASKHARSGIGTRVYAAWLMLQLLVVLAAVTGAHVLGIQAAIWPGQVLRYLYVVVAFEWTNFAALALLQFGDAKGATVRAQLIAVIGQLVKVVALLALYAIGRLDLVTFIAASYLGALVIAGGTLGWLVYPHRAAYLAREQSEDAAREVRKFYIAFCAPLVVYTAASFAYDFFDRWFLQTVAGSVQQGFFGLAMQWSALSLFFTTSLLNILWRELAVALAGGNMDRVRELYVRSSSLLYFCAAVIGTYIAVSAPELVTRLAGPQYQGAITVLVLMAFLPLHQTLGQINGTFYFATERVRVYRNLGIMSMLLGMGVSYVFLAPATLPIPGLHLGAVGLALKLVAASLIMANVFIVHNSRYLGIAYWPQLRRQGVALVLTCAIAAIARLLVTALPITNVWLRLGLVGIVYGALLVGVIFRFPDAAGLRNRDLALAASWFSAIARGGRRS